MTSRVGSDSLPARAGTRSARAAELAEGAILPLFEAPRKRNLESENARTEGAQDALTLARQLGRREAEAFDLRLRSAEAREREERLAVAAWQPGAGRGDEPSEDDSIKVVQLEARVSELTRYVKAVDDSLPWRLIQSVRRLMGRAW